MYLYEKGCRTTGQVRDGDVTRDGDGTRVEGDLESVSKGVTIGI